MLALLAVSSRILADPDLMHLVAFPHKLHIF
jgi:hypothetical protein